MLVAIQIRSGDREILCVITMVNDWGQGTKNLSVEGWGREWSDRDNMSD